MVIWSNQSLMSDYYYYYCISILMLQNIRAKNLKVSVECWSYVICFLNMNSFCHNWLRSENVFHLWLHVFVLRGVNSCLFYIHSFCADAESCKWKLHVNKAEKASSGKTQIVWLWSLKWLAKKTCCH